MKLSQEQEFAVEEARKWLSSDQQIFRLFGFAGTGKSTVAHHIGMLEEQRGGYVQYAAYTGKAASVLKNKGCYNAKTIHSLIYICFEASREELDRLVLLREEKQGDFHAIREIDYLIRLERENLQRPQFSPRAHDSVIMARDWATMRPKNISLFIIDAF